MGVGSFEDLVAYKQAVSLADDLRGSADQARFLLFARGSAYEVQHWIERAFARSLITDDTYRARAASVGRLVNGLHRANRRKARATSD
jgi:four helix bundle protein